MNKLINACLHALRHNLDVKNTERVLIMTDKNKRSIGEAFYEATRTITTHVELTEVPVPHINGEEPEGTIATKMLIPDVILLPLSKSISWTAARMAATERGARIASLPQITDEIILRNFPCDYADIRLRANRLCDALDQANQIRVTTELGTDLTFSVAGRQGHGRKGGIYMQPGHWGNLPCGEAFIAPLEGTANGTYVVDASHAGVGKLETPITITVKNGMVVGIEGGAQADALAGMLKAVGDPNAVNIAEFGIGCNDRARICGITLEDEKVLGTCHIALGNNIYFGGRMDVSIHVDGVLRKPTISLDDFTIIQNGKWLV